MAKQLSFKQQVMQSIADKQIEKVLAEQRQQGIAQLQADYDAWNNDQAGIAELKADYDNWLKAQQPQDIPVSPVQKIPSLSDYSEQQRFYTPKEKAEFVQSRQDYLNALKGPMQSSGLEDYQKQQQLENMEVSNSGKRVLSARRPIPAGNTIPQEVPEEVISQYAQINGMTPEQARAEIEANLKAQNTALAPAGDINTELTQKAQANSAEQKRKDAQKKQNPFEAALNNAGDAITGIVNGPVRLLGKAFGKDWDLVGDTNRQKVKEAQEQHPTASTIGRIGGMAAGAYMLGGGAGGRALSANGAPTAGEALKAGYEDALVNGGTKAQAILNGAGTAARQLGANTLRDMPIDLATDIIPTLSNDVAEGKSTKEIAKNTALNVGINAGFNAIGDIASLAKPVGDMAGVKGLKNAPEALNDVLNVADDIKPLDEVNGAKNALNEVDALKNMDAPKVDDVIETPNPNKVMAEDIGLRGGKDKSIEGVWKLEDSAPKSTDDLWSELEKGSKGQQDINPVGHTTEMNAQGQKLSRLHETLQNTEMLSDAEKQAYADKNGFWYDPDNERQLAAQAQQEVANDLEGVYKQYAEGVDPGKLSGADAHKMFTASFDYSKMAQEALANGDEAAAKLYNQKARNIMLNAREAATKGGQFNAAIAYYSKTPQGYIDKAYGLLDKQIVDFKAKNPKLSNGIDELSKGISNMLKDTDVEGVLTGTDEAAKDTLRRNVLDGISDMIEKSKNKQLKNAFKNLSLSDMDDIMASNYQADIARTLDMFSMGSFGVKPETVDKVMDIFAEAEKYGYNSKEYYKLEQEAFNLLANDLCNGKSFGDKINAWRYFSMLSSPLTHIKNNLGNLNNNVLTGIKNNVAASIEIAADRVAKAKGLEGLEGGRTKTFLNPVKDMDLISGAAKDFDNFSYRQYKEGGNKWLNASQELSRAGHTFKDKGLGKAANFLTEGNSDLLDVEDIIAGKAKYQTSLAGFLKANGADASIFSATDDASKELLAQGRQFALNQANEATFHQSNAFAELWSKGIRAAKESDSKALKGLGYTADTVLPFVKTPSNILAQSFAYSPLEFIKVAAETGKLKKGVITPAQYINDIAKGVTGTMGLALGALLQHEGILYVGTGDKDLDSYNAKRGINPMTIKVGDKYVSLSELAPAAMSLISGATSWFYLKQALNGDGDMALDALTSGVYSMAESINDMTMLNGVADTLSAVRYADSDTDVLSSIGRTVAGNFVGQLLPTVGSKIEKTVDDTKRTTYTDKKGKAAKYWSQEGNYLKTKIPFLQEAGEKLEPTLPTLSDYMTNEPSIGQWGEELKQQDYGLGGAGRFINNFLNPLATTTDTSDSVDNELRALYDEVKDNKILNYGMNASSNSTVDGNKLTPKQWTAFSEGFGSLKHELAEALMSMEGYKDMDPADKVEAYDQLGKFAKAYTYNQVTGKELKSANQGYADSYNQGGAKAVVEQIAGKSQGKAATQAAGVRSNSAAGKAIAEAQAKGDSDKVEQIAETAKSLKDYGLTYKGPYETYEKAQQVIPGLGVEQFAETYKAIDADSNQGIKQDEIIDYLNKTHASQAEGKKIWNAYGKSSWQKIPSLEDGVWSKKAK